MDLENIWLRIIRNLKIIGFVKSQESKQNHDICPNCGYLMIKKGTVSTCLGRCSRIYVKMSAKRKIRVWKKFRNVPYKCPICGKSLTYPYSKSQGIACKKCGAVYSYGKDMKLQ